TFAAALPSPGDLRSRESYRPLLDLCRLLVDGLTPGEDAGTSACPTFLLDMERVFEHYCTAHIAAAFERDAETYTVSVQPFFRSNQPPDAGPDFHMRPDLTLDRDGVPVVVLDTKWKHLPGAALVTADVYQVLAYCTALGVRRAMLVYPGQRDQVWNYRLD